MLMVVEIGSAQNLSFRQVIDADLAMRSQGDLIALPPFAPDLNRWSDLAYLNDIRTHHAELTRSLNPETSEDHFALARPNTDFLRSSSQSTQKSGASSPSSFIWSLADISFSRAQDQLKQIAVQGFIGDNCNFDPSQSVPGNIYLARVIPETCAILLSDDFDISRLGFSSARIALQADLRRLPYSLPNSILSHSDLSQSKRELLWALTFLNRTVIRLSEGAEYYDTMGELISGRHSFDDLFLAQEEDLELRQGLMLFAAFISSFTEAREGFFAPSTAEELEASVWAMKINLCTNGHEKLCNQLDFVKTKQLLANSRTHMRRFLDRYTASLQELTTVPNDQARLRVYGDLVAQGTKLLGNWISEVDNLSQMETDLSAFEESLGLSVSIYRNILEGSHSKTYFELSSFISKRVFTDLPMSTTSSKLLFMVLDIASAKEATELSAVLDTYLAPKRGFTRKRKPGSLYFGINSYVGANYFFEERVTIGDELMSSKAAGPALPIGLEFGFAPYGLKGWSAGLLVQFLDLGAVLSWQLSKNDSINDRPVIGINQVFSPGAFAVVHVPNKPLSVGFGLQLAPKLRRLDGDDGQSYDALRYGLFAAFDIPLFP